MRSLIVVILLCVCVSASAQTTFILVRHAEKEAAPVDPKDPMLSKEGQERSQRLVKLLEKQNIDAIYSTNYNRTKNTVKPLADSKGIQVQTYDKQPDVSNLKGTVVICGHSNTIPALANILLGSDQFKNFEETDFGNVLIITVSSSGKGQLTHLRY